jgi:alkanesulfonate monooxygenase SsuD/methylene tetrahydromethanopterin reductase-like flavin-dependent oxidoreductase (luciferase family)
MAPARRDYKGYDRIIASLKDDDFDKQMERGICWAGSPDEVADMIADSSRETGGFDIASLHVMPHVMEASVAENSMRLFSERVMPKFR